MKSFSSVITQQPNGNLWNNNLNSFPNELSFAGPDPIMLAFLLLGRVRLFIFVSKVSHLLVQCECSDIVVSPRSARPMTFLGNVSSLFKRKTIQNRA
jgi:hypothetical protein